MIFLPPIDIPKLHSLKLTLEIKVLNGVTNTTKVRQGLETIRDNFQT